MGHIVADDIIASDVQGRAAGSFKDGTYIRRIEVLPGNTIVFATTEGAELYRETSCPANFAIRTISAEHSSFSGCVVLVLGGFTPDSGDARVVTIVTDYRVAPEVSFQG